MRLEIWHNCTKFMSRNFCNCYLAWSMEWHIELCLKSLNLLVNVENKFYTYIVSSWYLSVIIASNIYTMQNIYQILHIVFTHIIYSHYQPLSCIWVVSNRDSKSFYVLYFISYSLRHFLWKHTTDTFTIVILQLLHETLLRRFLFQTI